MTDATYKFYRKQKSIEDLMLEVAQSEVKISNLMDRAITENAETQNKLIIVEIANLKKEQHKNREQIDEMQNNNN